MTATEILRRLLDERGVEYVEDYEYGKKYPPERSITWSCDIAGEDMTVTARDYFIGDGEYCLDLEFHEVFTPEQAIAATLGAGTCEADETDLIPFVRADSGDFEVDYIHVMECTECGHTYEHVNGDYEFCPRCGRKRKDVWLVMAALCYDNVWLKGAYIALAILNVVKSLKAYVEDE